jgi:hypothetical protein
VQLALFDEKHTPIAALLSGQEGEFEIKEVPPGSYTLVVGKETLHGLSIPLRIRTSTSTSASVETALQLIMRSEMDKRQSAATLITNQFLRAELLEMVKKDQDIRHAWIRQGVDQPPPEIQAQVAAIDAQNLARMQEIVLQYGWPGPVLVGMDGTEAAFLLVQHAPYAFQKKMLSRIGAAYRAGKLTGQDYALLLDRVRVHEGKPQIYGTQTKAFAEWKDQEPAFLPIEDEAHVDQRRAEVGLPPLTEYRKLLKEMYFPSGKGRP